MWYSHDVAVFLSSDLSCSRSCMVVTIAVILVVVALPGEGGAEVVTTSVVSHNGTGSDAYVLFGHSPTVRLPCNVGMHQGEGRGST